MSQTSKPGSEAAKAKAKEKENELIYLVTTFPRSSEAIGGGPDLEHGKELKKTSKDKEGRRRVGFGRFLSGEHSGGYIQTGETYIVQRSSSFSTVFSSMESTKPDDADHEARMGEIAKNIALATQRMEQEEQTAIAAFDAGLQEIQAVVERMKKAQEESEELSQKLRKAIANLQVA